MNPYIDVDAEFCQNPDLALTREWIITNGLGGYAFSTISGCNTRKYHGLLAAALDPPVDRRMSLSKFKETVMTDEEPCSLSCDHRPEGFDSDGLLTLVNFRMAPDPVFTYASENWEIEKSLFMVQGQNTLVVIYRLLSGIQNLVLRVTPLVTDRSIHDVIPDDPEFIRSSFLAMEPGRVVYQAPRKHYALRLYNNSVKTDSSQTTLDVLLYPTEPLLGYAGVDKLLNICEMHFSLSKEHPAWIIATTESDDPGDPFQLEKMQSVRNRFFIKKSRELHPDGTDDPVLQVLLTAADSFVVKRGDGKSVIAGYPWFADWGRDTMIALPGLFLSTRRFEEARQILLSFLKYYRDGLIPNCFPEEGREPIYNTVDASLWFIHAAYEYYMATGDDNTIRTPLYQAVADIIKHYIAGTRFGIKQDTDGLIMAGEEGYQLTWMDAKVDDIVVTPRMGKNVEINALWYHALKIAAVFADLMDDQDAFAAYEMHAEKVREAFIEQFWFEENAYLLDTIGPDGPDSGIRPNQVFAISLPHPVLTGEKAEKVLRCIQRCLLTPYGLRTLAPDAPEFKGIYEGDLRSRDFAYHQGTVWGWLIGPYIDALIKVEGNSPSVAEKGLQILEPLIRHLGEAGLGQVSEIFDGNAPHTPRGCIAQAWSVGELLRTYLKLLGLKSR
ncbi:MAG TPA: amylo-alpha-1,6-glucosidase [Candidatus Sumerlaeota bacterium]|nr:amylo-alpha-1,6-glucosidase [Candidatus Sumerlaeota bacterium]